MSKSDFSNMGLPGVEIVPRPRGSILRTTRASQLPYSEKKYVFVKFRDFPLFPYYSL